MNAKTNKASGGNSARFALELKGVSKSFGLVRANQDIELQIESGTIHGIIGENGAGKSTLMNILYGIHRADEGEMFVKGELAQIKGSSDAINLGIGMVHQHFMLVSRFTVLENVMLGSEGSPILSEGEARVLETLERLGDTYGMKVDPHALISDLNVGMRQRVEILKALKGGAEILILDEPTGVLTPQETDQLFEILRVLRQDGVTILLITHKLDEIMSITDNVSVMRGGKIVGHRKTAETNSQELASLMVGRDVLLSVDKGVSNIGDVVVSVEDLSAQSSRGYQLLSDISFDVRAGEILGISGVSGNGQTPLMEILTGMRKPSSGRIKILGDELSPDRPKTPSELRDLGLAHIPEDRHVHGLVLDFQAKENMVLGYHRTSLLGDKFLIDTKKVTNHCEEQMEIFDVRPARSDLNAKNFSGGNQQKIVIARELFSDPKVLVVGQPTRGVDVGAIEFIHKQLIALRDAGCAIILISVELEEVKNLADRILVMNDGKKMGIVDAETADAHSLGLMMAGVTE